MQYHSDRLTVELSVHALCERALRGGDLGASYREARESQIDRGVLCERLQATAGGYYAPDVTLSHTAQLDGLYYTVEGRVDGVIRRADGLVVDAVQAVRRYAFYEPPNERYLARLRCLCYFLLVREECTEIRGRLTYYNVDNGKIKHFAYHFSAEELKAYYFDLLGRIRWQAELARRHAVEELPTARMARFPYHTLREGQEMMIRECHAAIRRGQRLFVEAPTGTGKTISSLYPAVRALGEGHIDKIFYLTAKASTRHEAYRAAAELFGSGTALRTVVITAKEQCCANGARLTGMATGNLCHARGCERARGYYDRLDMALRELLAGGNGYPRKRIAEVAAKYGICSYELSLDLSEYCDIVICDYNYAFDPSVYFRRYFSSDAEKQRYVFLVDEAHNLADRARDMYSAALCRAQFFSLAEALTEAESALVNALDAACRAFLPLHALCGDTLVRDADGQEQGYFAAKQPPANFDRAMGQFAVTCDAWMKKNRAHPLSDRVSELLGAVRRYLHINEYFGRGFLSYVQVLDGDIRIKTCCLDPSAIMDSLLHRAHATVFLSATLTPLDYYGNLLGGMKHAASVSLPSPFDTGHLCVAVADYVSTRMEVRKKNTARFVGIIAAAASARPGNYIAYFPSYACLEEVLALFTRKYPKVQTVVQKRNMGVREREEFLSAFAEDTGRLRIGFCVLGGAFAEGVDLPGSRLIGAIVFGVGLPGLSDERNMIRDYVDPDGESGYDTAYTYPGMNRVLQAAGRVIRRDDDRGIVVLADDRYAEPRYRALFPQHWKSIQYAGNARSLAETVKRFWNRTE